jgi:two-component system phosphate regulon response regulator PhoB
LEKDNILIIEDDEDILELIRHNLTNAGFQTSGVTTGEKGLEMAETTEPDLIVLDLMLPGMDGLDVCRELKKREKTKQIPVLMLTAKSEEVDVVVGLEMGADDYVTKPFSPRVLTARIKAALRKRPAEVDEDRGAISIHNIEIHPGRHEVIVGDKHVPMTQTEFSVLHLLARRPGWVFTRNQIIDGIRDGNVVVTDRSVDVQIVNLRKKLGKSGKLIETVRGVGYRLREKSTA